jgi:hypothetical protein
VIFGELTVLLCEALGYVVIGEERLLDLLLLGCRIEGLGLHLIESLLLILILLFFASLDERLSDLLVSLALAI